MSGALLRACTGVSLVAAACGTTPPAPARFVAGSAAHFAERPYELRVPRGHDAASPAPLVIALDGLGPDPASDFVREQGLDRLADAKGFLLVAPDGRVSAEGHYWKATDACCDFHDAGADEDASYLAAIIDDVSARYRVDPKRVFVIGYSAGGAMAHRLACDASGKIAAIVSRAGAVWRDPSRCNPTTPVAIVEAHGTADEVVHYDGGGPARPGAGLYPSAAETVATWARKNGCTGELTPTREALHVDARQPANAMRISRYQGCPPGGDVELWTMEGTGHFTELLPAWNEAVWRFLASHPKP